VKARVVAAEDVTQIVDLLREQCYEVIAPFRNRGADACFDRVTDANRPAVALHLQNPLYPPKRFVLPHIQRLMRIEKGPDGLRFLPTVEERRVAIFGMRSCDVAGIGHLDRFYLDRDFKDIYYERLRQGLFIVNMACTVPGVDIGPDCFCVCTDTGPAARTGFDLQLVDLGDRYMAVAGTPAGETLLSAPIFHTGAPEDVTARRKVLGEARRSFADRTSWFAGAVRRVSAGAVSEETWEEIGNRCLECGGCTFVCPACTCFTVTDRVAGPDVYERVRVWDSCALAGFTRMAGGFNPRKAVHDRRNRRFFRKLSYYFVQRELSVACVGCGRCAAVCHGDIGMPSVVELLRRDTLREEAHATAG